MQAVNKFSGANPLQALQQQRQLQGLGQQQQQFGQGLGPQQQQGGQQAGLDLGGLGGSRTSAAGIKPPTGVEAGASAATSQLFAGGKVPDINAPAASKFSGVGRNLDISG